MLFHQIGLQLLIKYMIDMNLNEYFGFPEGTNATLRYSNFYDMVDSNFPCQKNMSYVFADEGRTCLKQINVTNDTNNLSYLFDENQFNLEYIEGIENWDVSNVEHMAYLFSDINMKEINSISNWNIKSNVSLSYLLYYNSKIEDASFIAGWNTNKITDMRQMFGYCSKLKKIPAFNCDSVTFGTYSSDGIFGGTLSKLTDLGGFINLKSQMVGNSSLKACPYLTYESCINVLNGLYDFTANNEVPTSKQAKLQVHQNFLDKVKDEISIGVNKGWSIYS